MVYKLEKRMSKKVVYFEFFKIILSVMNSDMTMKIVINLGK